MFDIPAGVEILHGRVHESFPFNGQVYARSCTTRFFDSLRASFGANGGQARSLDNNMSMYYSL